MASDIVKIASWVISHEDGHIECKHCPHKIDMSTRSYGEEWSDGELPVSFNNGQWYSVGWLLHMIHNDEHECV